MDNDFTGDVEELVRTLASNEVVAMRFVTVGQRLLLDFRTAEAEGPLVRVVPPVRSARERYMTLRQLRPHFDLPDRIVAVAWPGFARSLEASAAWETILRRLERSGDEDALPEARGTIAELCRLEDETHRHAIRGQGFRTLWSSSARQR
ncbi:MAG: hypothetical protein U5Q44_05385 [Dehalococcoidia bacterium]|nr:hypothetical protein [Dehalococcoidia bacterium]